MDWYLIITIIFHWYISDISNLTSLSDIFNITMKLSQIKNCIGFKDYDHVMIFAIKNFTFVMFLIIVPLKSKSLFKSKLKNLNQKNWHNRWNLEFESDFATMFLPSVLVNIIKTFPSLFKKSTKLTHWPSHYWERIFQKICWN